MAELAPDAQAIRRLQRQMDRQRRANNPRCEGARQEAWQAAPDVETQQAVPGDSTAQSHQGAQAGGPSEASMGAWSMRSSRWAPRSSPNKISYRARPQHFGKSVGLRAPGMFLDLLKPTVASTGGTGGSFHSTRSTKLSQFCHGCGQFVKKPLWQRWHACPCGIGPIQRDLSSAFLAAYLDVSRCSSLVCPVPGVPGRSGARPAGSIRAQHPTRKCGAAPASQLRYPPSETCVCPKVLAEPHKSRSPTGRGEAGNVEARRGTRPRLSPERSQHPTVGYHIVPTAKENSTVLKKLG